MRTAPRKSRSWPVAHCLLPVLSERTVARTDEPRAEARLVRWHRIARAAAAQSAGRTPIIFDPTPLPAALDRLAAAHHKFIVCFVDDACALADAIAPGPPASTALLLGPEGDFTPDEVAAARAAGFVPVHLGARILRSETAAVAAATLTLHALGALRRETNYERILLKAASRTIDLKDIASGADCMKSRFIASGIVLLLAAAAVYYFLAFPKLLLNRTFNHMVAAFEQEDVSRLMDYISSDYRDRANRVRADVEDELVFFFESREEIRCRVYKLGLSVQGKEATVRVRGDILFQTRQGPESMDLRRDPLVLSFVREKTGWRVVSVSGGDALTHE